VLRKLLFGWVGLSLAAVGCGPPRVTVSPEEPEGPAFFSQVLDAELDAGAGVSITADADGNPHLAYLALEEELPEGEPPPPPDPEAPELPAVKHAHIVDDALERTAVAEAQRALTAEDQTAIAVDGDGIHHVAWTVGGALFYANNSAGGEFGQPEPVAAEGASGLSISTTGDGLPLIAFSQASTGAEGPAGLIRVATTDGKSWTVDTAAEFDGGELATSGVGMDGDQVLVAYGDAGQTMLARGTAGGTFRSEVADGDGGFGVRMAVDADGNPHLAYYAEDGTVKHAHSVEGGPWEVTDVADAGGLPEMGSAAIAVDSAGLHHVAWQNDDGTLGYAQNAEGEFADEEVPNSEGAVQPGLAAAEEGVAYLAWYDGEGTELQMATRTEEEPPLALPSPEATTEDGGTPTGPAPCQPEGTELAITAPPGAVTGGFDTDCLAVEAEMDFTVDFSNQDSTTHNFSIYPDDSASESLFEGDIIEAGASTTYEPDPITETGNLFFRCDLHPDTMTGTFVVAGEEGGQQGGGSGGGQEGDGQ
jgi:plastocyanin